MSYKLFNPSMLILLWFSLWVCSSCSDHSKKANLQLEVQKAVDSIFSEIEDGNVPGISAIIWYKGEIAYQTHKGLSNLENASKIDAHTAFNIGQMADHYLAYGILKLATEGKIDLQENLNTYLNSSSELLNLIKVEHLLSHSSGLYDVSVLNELLDQNLTTPTSVMTLIEAQREFSFTPGTEFVLSRTNIFLLERILEKITGKTLYAYMSEEVFKPMGLGNTFYDTGNAGKNNKAFSYELDEEKYTLAANDPGMFSPRLFSSADDLLAWERFLVQKKNEGVAIIDLLNRVATLNNGMEFNQPEGKLTYGQRFLNAERGVPEVYNTGEHLGFASSIFRFPTADFMSIILTNNGMDYSGYFGVISSYELMKEEFVEAASTDFENLPQIQLSDDELEGYSGKFWDVEGEFVREIKARNDTLRYVRSEQNQSALLPIAKDTFQMVFPFDEVILVTFGNNPDGRWMNYIIADADPIPFVEIQEVSFEDMDWKGFIGKYKDDSYGVTFDIAHTNDSLVFSGKNSTVLSFGPLQDGFFYGGDWYLQSILFHRDESGKVLGFSANNPSIKNMFFRKQGQ